MSAVKSRMMMTQKQLNRYLVMVVLYLINSFLQHRKW